MTDDLEAIIARRECQRPWLELLQGAQDFCEELLAARTDAQCHRAAFRLFDRLADLRNHETQRLADLVGDSTKGEISFVVARLLLAAKRAADHWVHSTARSHTVLDTVVVACLQRVEREDLAGVTDETAYDWALERFAQLLRPIYESQHPGVRRVQEIVTAFTTKRDAMIDEVVAEAEAFYGGG